MIIGEFTPLTKKIIYNSVCYWSLTISRAMWRMRTIEEPVRLACLDAVLADESDFIFIALQQKHPLPASESHKYLLRKLTILPLSLEIICAIHSFPAGSAGGPDAGGPNGLRPQHLKDLTSLANTE